MGGSTLGFFIPRGAHAGSCFPVTVYVAHLHILRATSFRTMKIFENNLITSAEKK
jgi:hypothetical protein